MTRNATLSIRDRDFDVEMEISYHSSRSGESYEHFGFRGIKEVVEHEFSLDNVIATEQGDEVIDPRLLEQIQGEAEEWIADHHDELAQATGD